MPEKMPPMPRIENPGLVEAIDALHRENNRDTFSLAMSEVMRGVFLVPAQIVTNGAPLKPDDKGRMAIPRDTQVNFTLLNDQEGKKFFMAFTDVDNLRQWKNNPGNPCVTMRIEDIARVLSEGPGAEGVVINPFSKSLRLEKSLLQMLKQQKEALLAARTANAIKPDDEVVILEPSILPDELLDPICDVLKNYPAVEAAWLQMMVVNKTKKSYLIVLEGPQDPEIFSQVAAAARPYMTARQDKLNLNITLAGTPLGKQATEGSEPFYRKGIGRVPDEDED